MRGWLIIIVFFGAIVAVCWYGATGETGPMGWLNSLQSGLIGSYSRGASFFVLLCVAGAVIAVPVAAVRTAATRRAHARGAAAPASITAPADAKVAVMQAVMNDSTRWRLGTVVAIWLGVVAVIWSLVLGWNAWDFHRRAADASDTYAPLHLTRTAAWPRPEDGSHVALDGRLLWDRSVTRKSQGNGSTDPEVVFVPVAGADWRAGDPVQFVVQVDRTQAWALQHRADGADAPLLARVTGAIPTPSRAVFQKAEAPPTDDAVLVEVVASSAGQVRDASPRFDWEDTKLFGLALSGIWTAGLLVGVPLRLLKDRLQRRRQAKRAA